MTGMPLQRRSNHLLTIIMPWWSRREIQKRRMLRNAAWMTSITEKAGNLLSKAGITVGKGNKLEFDEDALKEKTALGKSGIEFDNISTLKSLFTGYGSFGSQISQKASAISSAAARTKGVDKTL